MYNITNLIIPINICPRCFARYASLCGVFDDVSICYYRLSFVTVESAVGTDRPAYAWRSGRPIDLHRSGASPSHVPLPCSDTPSSEKHFVSVQVSLSFLILTTNNRIGVSRKTPSKVLLLSTVPKTIEGVVPLGHCDPAQHHVPAIPHRQRNKVFRSPQMVKTDVILHVPSPPNIPIPNITGRRLVLVYSAPIVVHDDLGRLAVSRAGFSAAV